MTIGKVPTKAVPAPIVERAVLRRFNVAERSDIPTGRTGKHKTIVTQILSDLEGLEKGQCLKIPMDELPDSKVNIRSALSRAAHKLNQLVATAADEEFLYVWNG